MKVVVLRGSALTKHPTEIIYHDEAPGTGRTACKRWRHSYYPAATRGAVQMVETVAAKIGRLCHDCKGMRVLVGGDDDPD